MAYILVGGQGSVTTTQGDTFYTTLLSRMTIRAATLTVAAESHDVTAINTSYLKTLSGLRSWSVQVDGFAHAIPRLGNEGLVASTTPAFYVTNPRAWAVTLEPLAVHDVTSMNATNPTWRSFRPDNIIGARAVYTCGVDSTEPVRTAAGTEPIQAPGITDDTGGTDLTGFTFTFGNSATDETLAFEGAVTGYPITIMRAGKQEAVFSVVSSSTITSAGTANPIGSGSVAAPPFLGNASASAALGLRFQPLHGTRYFDTDVAGGGDAFWRRITFGPVEVGQPVPISIEFQGSGPLTTN